MQKISSASLPECIYLTHATRLHQLSVVSYNICGGDMLQLPVSVTPHITVWCLGFRQTSMYHPTSYITIKNAVCCSKISVSKPMHRIATDQIHNVSKCSNTGVQPIPREQHRQELLDKLASTNSRHCGVKMTHARDGWYDSVPARARLIYPVP